MEKVIVSLYFGAILAVIIFPAVDAYKSSRLTDRQRYNLLFLIFFLPVAGSFLYFFFKAYYLKPISRTKA